MLVVDMAKIIHPRRRKRWLWKQTTPKTVLCDQLCHSLIG